MRIIFVLLSISISLNFNAQDTINITGSLGNYYVETLDSIVHLDSKEYYWRKEEYQNNILFSIEYLASDKFHPIKEYKGFYPNGKLSFVRNYYFDGKYSELLGKKELYYSNGKLKESGHFFHSVCEMWKLVIL